MSQDMIGKRALVTGAARGLGLAIANRLASGGARVAVLDQDEAGAVAAAAKIGGRAIGLRCDVRSTAEVNAVTATAISQLGGLDILVNNSGIEVAGLILETSESDFNRLFDVNVLGVWRCTRAAVKALTNSGGAIVNIASALSLGNAPLLGAYSATEAATLRITESLAFELRLSGVRVNAVCPAFANTSMVERLAGPVGQVTKALGLTFEELVQMKQMRLGRPEEVAEAVAFLASGDSSWTTGSAFTLDGGLTGSLV